MADPAKMGYEPLVVQRLDNFEAAWRHAHVELMVRDGLGFWQQFHPRTFQDLVNRVVGMIVITEYFYELETQTNAHNHD